MVVRIVKGAVEAAPEMMERVKVDAKLFTAARKAAKTKKVPVAEASQAAE